VPVREVRGINLDTFHFKKLRSSNIHGYLLAFAGVASFRRIGDEAHLQISIRPQIDEPEEPSGKKAAMALKSDLEHPDGV
jgi:hypothetical protein